ncbi:cation channel family protein (macronuclear) [Tetrahymena thermophila SB210]|uniref:Cation channel family protein n=1 Tax=Tetrahymena thermophila (strain SB210) TaxID=312017 RepID=I7M1E3_TETTS|nr:cation channel family protein [Tetrahymena thermophila SB210]EAR96163.2 cation channel family protein [Tetrahymena thermophila SB210]|eukprot:XP_001016408.2 cation channel family protein [Tetrahymena thermophila SB210]
MRVESINQNDINPQQSSSYQLGQDNNTYSFYQFKISKLQQQNQSLGDQSNSQQFLPSQKFLNQTRNEQDLITEEDKRENCISQKDNQTDNSFVAVNLEETLYRFSDQCPKNISENNTIFQEIPKVDAESQKMTSRKRNGNQLLNQDKQKARSQSVSTQFRKKNNQILGNDCQSIIEKKDPNKIGYYQRGYKKRNNLLILDLYAQKDIWKRKWIQILALVSKVKYIAQQSSLFFRPSQLREIQYLPLFHNLSSLYILWEVIIFINSSILFVYLPLEYCFNLQREAIFSYYIQYICSIIFSIDIFIKFNTLSTQQGTFIEQHIQIFSSYVSSSFLIDLIAILSLCCFSFSFNGIQFLFFLKIFQAFRILETIREQFLLKTKIFGIISLIYLLGSVIYFAHLFTCLWNYVGIKELDQNEGWMVTYSYQNETVGSRYIQIFYYAIVTMTTIGYGDFTAQTKLEKFLMIFIAFFSCGIFGYTINSIGNILQDFKQRKDLYLQELAKINKYFKQNNVELGLQCRAKKYVQYLYSDQNSDNLCSIKSLSALSEYLQKEIQTDVYIKILKKVPLFKDILTEEIFIDLAMQMKEKIYCHDQQIILLEEDVEDCIYFVNNGIVLEYFQYDQTTEVKEVQQFKYGQYFGLLRFLQGDNNCNVKYKSVGVSSILQLNFTDFANILRKYDLQYEKFCYIKDEVKYQNKLQKVSSCCYSCKQKNHKIEECPYLFYEGKKNLILRKYLKEIEFKLKNFKRNQTEKSMNAILNQNIISHQADQYYIQNIEYFSLWDLSQESDYEEEEDEEEDFLVKQTAQQDRDFNGINVQNSESIYKDQSPDDQQNQSLKDSQSLQDQYENNLSAQKVFLMSNLLSRQTQDDDSITIEDSQYNPANLKKKNYSSKKIKTFDSNINFSINLDQEMIYNQQSLTKMHTYGKQDRQMEVSQISSNNKLQSLQVIRNIEQIIQQSNHTVSNCQIPNCQTCTKLKFMIISALKKIANTENQKLYPSIRASSFLEPKKKSSLFCIREKTGSNIQLQQNNSLNPNLNRRQCSSFNRNLTNNQSKIFSRQIINFSDQLFYYDFDKLKTFEYYFPEGNAQSIIEQYSNIYQNKNILWMM